MKKQAKDQLEFWTVYDNPKDFPGQFVARRFEVSGGQEPQPTKDALLGKTFKDIEEHFSKQGFTWLGRNRGDDPVIVGTYMR